MREPVDAPLVRIHEGGVLHSMDHFVMDLRDEEGGWTAFFTVYALGYMPEVGTGQVALLRVRGPGAADRVDLVLSETPELGDRMQQRLKRIVARSDVVRGIGTDLDLAAQPASFHRLPSASDRFGYRIVAGEHEIEAWWSDPEPPFWMAGPRGTLHDERDIVATMFSCWGASLTVDGLDVSGVPYEHEWWRHRLGRRFSSTHVALAETATTATKESFW